MRIGMEGGPSPIQSIALARASQVRQAFARVSGGDALEVSARARQIETVRTAIQGLPEVREDRVAGLRAQIASDHYQVPAIKCATSMLKEFSTC